MWPALLCYIRLDGAAKLRAGGGVLMALAMETVTLTGPMVFLIFLAGVAIGWIAAKMRGGTIDVQLSGQTLPPGSVPGGIKITKSVVRRLTLKRQCGAKWDFAEGSGALPAGTKPFPTGDTFECPSCGRSMDLKAERKLEAEALAGLNLPKTN